MELADDPIPRAATLYDIFINPAVRDADILIAGLAFWFALQHGSYWLLNAFNPTFRRLKPADKDDLCVRICAVVNGICSLRAAYLYVFVAPNLGAGLYTTMPEYFAPLMWLVSYFTWDFFVCLWYGWGVAYTLHAFVSGFGMYLAAYPHSHLYTGYYSGVFEVSNVFLHGAFVLRKLELYPRLCTVFDVIFAVLFMSIRVIGGTYVAYSWCCVMGSATLRGEVHSAWVCWYSLVTIWIVNGLSYYWSGTLIKAVMETLSPTKELAPSPTTRDKKQFPQYPDHKN